MKPKFKFGQMLETATGFGKVVEIRVKSSGCEYLLEGATVPVTEKEIIAVYKKVEPRKTREAKKPEVKVTKKS
jgi:hypothetical protein